MLVEPQLHPLDAAGFAREQARIIAHITGRHVVRGYIEIGQAEQLPLMAQLVVLEKAAADEHEATLGILAVEANARQMIEERVDMGIRMHFAQPHGPLTRETLQTRAGGSALRRAWRFWHRLCRHAQLNAGL